jgi:hypothetical protein
MLQIAILRNFGGRPVDEMEITMACFFDELGINIYLSCYLTKFLSNYLTN